MRRFVMHILLLFSQSNNLRLCLVHTNNTEITTNELLIVFTFNNAHYYFSYVQLFPCFYYLFTFQAHSLNFKKEGRR